ncbi:MAG: glycosyltransferase [Candidatus Heimdallarchaeota archaeon]|nr:glycosyltransferase [Candidatus Heimdallarchaeota archaeon]
MIGPVVTIVTPSYNQGRFIRRTIESVLGQDYSEIEYIVIDGGSTDETVSILQEYEGDIKWVSEKDDGQTDAINKGIQLSRGSIIAYLNSDDIYLPGTISYIVEKFNMNKEVDFIYGDFYAIDKADNIIDKIKTISYDPNILLYDANYISQPASFYTKRLINEIGLFDDSLRYLMDYEFFLRAAKRKVRFMMVPRYLSAIRYHKDCKTLEDGVYPWDEERNRIKKKYARKKVYNPSSMRLLAFIFRMKRYLKLILRGRIDFMNLRLALKLRRIRA